MKIRHVSVVLALIMAPAIAQACSIPVFRYALERWELTPYELTVFFDKPLPADLEKKLKELESGPTRANVKIERVDVTGKIDAYHIKLWSRQGADKTLPWLSARLPETEASLSDAFSGPLTVDNLRRLLDSPSRQQLVERLSKGTTAVFLLLPGTKEAANQKAAELLDKELARLAKLVVLPELKPEDKLKTGVPLKIEFVTLQLKRDDPAEQLFIQALLNSEPGLEKVRGPIVFPVFGRGRLLCSLFGEDLDREKLTGVVRFVCGECSCTLKELNPGSDLLITAEWPAIFEKAGPPKTGAELPAPKGTPPTPVVSEEPRPTPATVEVGPAINAVEPRPASETEPVIVPSSEPSTNVSSRCETCPVSAFVHRHGWLGIGVIGAGVLVLVTGMWFFLQRKQRVMNLAKSAFLGSVALLAGLSALLYWQTRTDPGQVGAPLVVYCAESFRVPLEAIKLDFEKESSQQVELRYGPSADILSQLSLSKQGDLFLPADDSYIELAKKKDLVAEILPMATMRAVVVTKPDWDKSIKSWDDVVAPGVKLGLANPDAAAIGKILRGHLRKQGRWDAVVKQQPVMLGTVNQVGNAAQLGTIDAGVMWDAVAASFPKVKIVNVPELKDVTAQVQIAVAKSSSQPTQALRFARFATAKDRGLEHLKKQGFVTTPNADAWKLTPELLLYSGSMLRPAIERTVEEFQKREGARITTVYNGCGILVAGMKETGERPDVYFACDTQFMNQVSDLFGPPINVSTNQLVIAVHKGNKHDLQSLKDLGKPGLRVGVGHEQQCALGALTKESFIKTGTYAAVQKNVAVQSPSGDLLIVQLRGGSLDAVVCYQSNVTPFADQFDAIPVTGLPCATPQQPLAIGKNSPYPTLAARLEAALQSAESRRRFEELGFGWEGKK